MRAALHAHILCWFKPRSFPKDYKPIPAIPRTALGVEPRQRPTTQKVDPLPVYQHDHVYQAAHVGPMVAELARPDVSGKNRGGYDLERLGSRWVGPRRPDTAAISTSLHSAVLLEKQGSMQILLPLALPAASVLLREHGARGLAETPAFRCSVPAASTSCRQKTGIGCQRSNVLVVGVA